MRIRTYGAKKLLQINRELIESEKEVAEEIWRRSLELLIEELALKIDERMRKFELDIQGLRELMLQMLMPEEVIELRSISKEEAKAEIKEYVFKHPGCLTSKIVEDLKLDPVLVVEILEELKREGALEGKEIAPWG